MAAVDSNLIGALQELATQVRSTTIRLLDSQNQSAHLGAYRYIELHFVVRWPRRLAAGRANHSAIDRPNRTTARLGGEIRPRRPTSCNP
jgi:hypothetical protein